VKLPDVNLLVYAINRTSPHHARARPWLDELLSGAEPVGLAWMVLVAFVRLSTRPQLSATPLSPTQAFDVVEGWLAQPCAVIVHPTERHYAVLRGLLEPLGTAGNLTNDAHLAALAIEHGGEVCSADIDFARFRGLRWSNPLADPTTRP
jgi:toxin-antitoxin system PIN domain toxin